MSSRHVTVQQLIDKLKEYPTDLLVAISVPYVRPTEAYEGYLDGPSSFKVIKVQDVRSGFNPVGCGFSGSTQDADWPVLYISAWE